MKTTTKFALPLAALVGAGAAIEVVIARASENPVAAFISGHGIHTVTRIHDIVSGSPGNAVIAGLTIPNRGTARLYEHSITEDMDEIRGKLGVVF